MDSPRQRPEVRFRPDRRFTALAGVGLAASALVAAFTGDPAGRLLAVVAAAILAAYVVGDVVFNPRVTVDATGIVLNSPFNRVRLDWSDVADVRAHGRLRLGLRSTTLEVDAGSVLAVFSRRSLGADPVEAAELINAFRPRW